MIGQTWSAAESKGPQGAERGASPWGDMLTGTHWLVEGGPAERVRDRGHQWGGRGGHQWGGRGG